MKREIIDPRWANDDKNQIVCKFKLEDGNIITAAVSVPEGGKNPDWDEIMEKFGPDVLDANLEADKQAFRKKREEDEARQKEEMERLMKEALFNAKAEAFDIELIKKSKNKDVKNKIRRASSIMEVTAYTAALIMLEDPLFSKK